MTETDEYPLSRGDGHRLPHSVASSLRALALDPILIAGRLASRLRTVAAVAAFGILATAAVLFSMTPRYTAEATLLLNASKNQRPMLPDPLVQIGDLDAAMIESQLEILRSPRMAERVLALLDPQTAAAAVGGSTALVFGWQSQAKADPAGITAAAGAGPDPATGAGEQQEGSAKPAVDALPAGAAETLLKSLEVERKGRSNVLRVRYRDTDPERAAVIANAFIDAYLGEEMHAKTLSVTNASRWLRQRIDELGRTLREDEDRLQAFRVEKNLVDTGEMSLAQRETTDYANQLVLARARAAEAQARLDQVKALSGQPDRLLAIDMALRSTVIGDFLRQQAELERKIGEATSRFGELHQSVVDSRAELSQLRKEIDREISRIVTGAQMDFDAAIGHVALLERGLAELEQQTLERSRHLIELNQLKRNIEASATLYSVLLRRYKETEAQEQLFDADARVVSYATPPGSASHPKKALLLGAASLAWILIATGIVLTQELRHLSVRTPEDVERMLGLPCIGLAPAVAPLDAPVRTSRRSPAPPLVGPFRDTANAGLNQTMFALRRWLDGAAGPSPVVVVASPNAQDGRSTIAAQFARHAARMGVSTLLVDADHRNSGMTAAIAGEAELPTLEGYVRGDYDLSGAVMALGGEPNLHLCAAPSKSESDPLTLLGSCAIERFFASARESFSLVVVDSPPARAFIDSGALIDHADAVVVVIEPETAHRDAVECLLRLNLTADHAIAVVLNSGARRA